MRSKPRPGWFELLKEQRTPFMRYVAENQRRVARLTVAAGSVLTFLKDRITTRGEAREFWRVVPAVLKRCDDQQTYDQPMASEAYAWIHLLDRYVRTWYALEQMFHRACFPLGSRGVNVLDVGTGPGPSVPAIVDFFRELRRYAFLANEPRLDQPCHVTAVELSWANNRFRDHFYESALHPWGHVPTLHDITRVDPQRERAELRRRLKDEEYDLMEQGILFFPFADDEAQLLHRYRMIVLSNFLTNDEVTKLATPALRRVLTDVWPGAVLMVIGGVGNHYPALYQQLDALVKACGLRLRLSGRRVASRPADAAIILEVARAVAAHVERLHPMTDDVPKAVRAALNGEEPWGSTSVVRVYRRNARPRRVTA